MPTPSKRTIGTDSIWMDGLLIPAAGILDTGVEIGDLGAEGAGASDSTA